MKHFNTNFVNRRISRMNKYIKQNVKYVFASDKLIKGKAYHIINNMSKDNDHIEDSAKQLNYLPNEFDAIFNYIDINGYAIFLIIADEVEWIDINPDDIAFNNVDIQDMDVISNGYIKLEDSIVSSNNKQSIVDMASGILESHKRMRSEFDTGSNDILGKPHQPSIEEKESYERYKCIRDYSDQECLPERHSLEVGEWN